MKAKMTLVILLFLTLVAGVAAPISAGAIVQKKRNVYVRHRSTKRQVEIVGGSAAGGALIGGVAGGTKGALIGGAVGAGAGAIYNHATKNKRVPE